MSLLDLPTAAAQPLAGAIKDVAQANALLKPHIRAGWEY